MSRSYTSGLRIKRDAFIDLQTHTQLSDGEWTPEELVDYFVHEGFSAAAITDHDRVDTITAIQTIAKTHNFPLLAATEMTTTWHGETVDILCFGFEDDLTPLQQLCDAIQESQSNNTRQVYKYLVEHGFITEHNEDELQNVLKETTSMQPIVIVDLFVKHNPDPKDYTPLKDAGYTLCTNPTKDVVEAAHECGGIALIAHPGRTDGFATFDTDLLNQFRTEIPIDGIEVYYPKHTEKQIKLYKDYANKHNWLISAGSDSHTRDNPPIKYEAHLCAKLLARLGITIV